MQVPCRLAHLMCKGWAIRLLAKIHKEIFIDRQTSIYIVDIHLHGANFRLAPEPCKTVYISQRHAALRSNVPTNLRKAAAHTGVQEGCRGF